MHKIGLDLEGLVNTFAGWAMQVGSHNRSGGCSYWKNPDPRIITSVYHTGCTVLAVLIQN